jgi:hypothetical protein
MMPRKSSVPDLRKHIADAMATQSTNGVTIEMKKPIVIQRGPTKEQKAIIRTLPFANDTQKRKIENLRTTCRQHKT